MSYLVKGFTIIEFLLVVGVISVLYAVSLFFFEARKFSGEGPG